MVDYPEIELFFETFKISSKELRVNVQNFTEFEIKVLTFANDWLSGKNQFEFQTSGSTGDPRKIRFTRDQIKASANLTKNFFHLRQGHKALLCLDPDFVAARMMIVRALEIGMDLYCFPPASNPIKNLNELIDLAAFVPYQLEAILNSGSSDKLNFIKSAIIGGSAVQDGLVQGIQSNSTRFFETYGMTETLTHIALRKLNPVQSEFHILPGVNIFLDDRLCLNIKASHLGNEIIKTNDLAALVNKTSFKILGRYDNVINTAGLKVSPETLEQKIKSILQNTLPDCPYFIAGVNDKDFGEKVILYIECSELSQDVKNRLIAEFKSNLKKWEVPKEIIAIPKFKRTNSGKINRKTSQPD